MPLTRKIRLWRRIPVQNPLYPDPKARDWFDLPGLLDELAEIYQQLNRVDDALAAMQAAIDAGYDGDPDPRCRLAEIMLRAGHTKPAAQGCAQVKARHPG